MQNFFNTVKKASQPKEALISISASLKSDFLGGKPRNVPVTTAKITIKNSE